MSLIPEQQSTSLRFHFNCFALVQIDAPEDDDPIAELVGGFYKNREAAEQGADKEELDRRGMWQAWRNSQPDWRLSIGDKSCFPPVRFHYEIVPLSSVRFDSLSELETAIEKAALLQFAGIGKEVVNA